MSVIYFIFQQTMPFTTPLMIVAPGGMFSERSGVVNIALEGIMTMGALTGILSLNMTGDRMSGRLQLLLTILISTAMGAVFVFFHAYASINIKTNQAISGTVLNMLAPTFTIFMTRVVQEMQQIRFSDTSRVESVPPLGNIPLFGPLLFRSTYIATYLGIVILVLSILVFYRTRLGLKLCSYGEHPHAIDAAGISVCYMQYAGALIFGILGDLGGLALVVPISASFNADVAGYGFLTLAVLILGQWKPVRIMWASPFFGFMEVVAAAYSSIPFLAATRIPSYVYKMIPCLATLIALVFTSRNSQAPRASGVSYDRGQK